MTHLYDYSDFLTLLNEIPEVRAGIVVDTNVLIAATYEPDRMHETSSELLDLIFDEGVPLYCNVNARMEFLEIHRRIILTEALLEFSTGPIQKFLPDSLVRRLNSAKTKNAEREKKDLSPFRFGEKDLKEIMLDLVKISHGGRDLWTVVCADRVGNKLEEVWTKAEVKLGLNFMSTRKEDLNVDISRVPTWEDAVGLMEKHGLSSSDAMILNAFLSSEFRLLLSRAWRETSTQCRLIS